MTKSEPTANLRVGVHEAKTRLSELLRLVDAGQEIEILRAGHPVARLVPVPRQGVQRLGLDAGAFVVPDDFDAPLPDVEAAFYE
jgi:prevent-host-death family protein